MTLATSTLRGIAPPPSPGASPTRPAATDLRAMAKAAYGGGGTDYASPVPRSIKSLRAMCLTVLCAWFASLTLTAFSIEAATRVVGHDAAPSVVAAERVRSLLADANGNFADLLLVRDGEDGPFVTAFRQDVRDAETALAEASRNVTYGDEETAPITTIMRGVAEYAGLVGQARAAAEGNARSASLGDAERADTLMHFTILPAAAALDRVNHDHLSEEYAAHRTHVTLLLLASGLLSIAALGALAWLQAYLARRTKRLVDPLVAAAIAAVAVASVWGMGTGMRAESHLSTAKADAFDSVYAMSTAEADANDANASESLWLLAASDPAAQSAQADKFAARTATLVMDPIDNARRDAAQGKRFRGSLGDEIANVTFPGERDAALAALTYWSDYLRIDGRIRSLAVSGDLQGATDLDVGSQQGQSNWAFERFSRAVDSVIDINRREFDAAIRSSESLVGLPIHIGLLVAWAIGCAGVWMAAARRLKPYGP